MQFERQQFLIYNFAIGKLRWLLSIVLATSLIIVVLFTGVRMHYAINRNTDYLKRCMDNYMERYKPENNSLLGRDQLLRIELVSNRSQQVYQETDCLIAENESSMNGQPELRLFEDSALEYVSEAVKKSRKVQIIYITLALGKIAGSSAFWWFGSEAVVLDQLAEQIQRRNISKFNIRDYTASNYIFDMKSQQPHGWFVGIFKKLLNLINAFAMTIFISTFCGVMVTLFNIFVNALLIPFVELFRRCGWSEVTTFINNPLNEHLNLLRGNPRHGILDKYLMVAFVGLSYLLFVGIQGFLHFVMPYLFGLYELRANYTSFIMVCIIEELSILLFRTRTSIKMAPTTILLLYMINMYLRESNEFALPQYWAYLAFWLSLSLIMALALFVEAAVADGSDANLSKPTQDRPRACYFPVYNLSWHWSMPPLWTCFVKVHSREFFNEGQLSYVDRNHDLLLAQLTGLAASAAGHPGDLPLEEPDDLIML